MSSSGKNEREVVRCVIKDDTRGLEAFAIWESNRSTRIYKKYFIPKKRWSKSLLFSGLNWSLKANPALHVIQYIAYITGYRCLLSEFEWAYLGMWEFHKSTIFFLAQKWIVLRKEKRGLKSWSVRRPPCLLKGRLVRVQSQRRWLLSYH